MELLIRHSGPAYAGCKVSSRSSSGSSHETVSESLSSCAPHTFFSARLARWFLTWLSAWVCKRQQEKAWLETTEIVPRAQHTRHSTAIQTMRSDLQQTLHTADSILFSITGIQQKKHVMSMLNRFVWIHLADLHQPNFISIGNPARRSFIYSKLLI